MKEQSMQDDGLMNVIRGYLPSGRKVMMWFAALVFLFMAFLSKGLIETKQPDDILVIQSAYSGDLTW